MYREREREIHERETPSERAAECPLDDSTGDPREGWQSCGRPELTYMYIYIYICVWREREREIEIEMAVEEELCALVDAGLDQALDTRLGRLRESILSQLTHPPSSCQTTSTVQKRDIGQGNFPLKRTWQENISRPWPRMATTSLSLLAACEISGPTSVLLSLPGPTLIGGIYMFLCCPCRFDQTTCLFDYCSVGGR